MDTKNYNMATHYFREMEKENPNIPQWGAFADAMDEVISTYVPIVRCRDCKFGEACKNGAGEQCVQCFNDDLFMTGDLHMPDWFCADGER